MNQRFPIFQTASRKLSWSHYVEIISIDNELERNFYYNQSIKDAWSIRELINCYVVIDLKIGKVTHEDIGQMNMYLGYFALDKNTKGDNKPIGIILAQEKNDVMVKYATYGMDSKLFVSKYQLYLPNIEELRAIIAGKT